MNSRVWTSHNGYSLGQSGYSLDVPRIVYFITHVYLYICILWLTRNVEPHWQLFPNTATFSTIARLQGFTTPKTGNGKRFQLLCHLQCGWSLSVFPKGCLALPKQKWPSTESLPYPLTWKLGLPEPVKVLLDQRHSDGKLCWMSWASAMQQGLNVQQMVWFTVYI